MSCQACQAENHEPADCENRNKPTIHRDCNCRCQQRDFDPAPYWTAISNTREG